MTAEHVPEVGDRYGFWVPDRNNGRILPDYTRAPTHTYIIAIGRECHGGGYVVFNEAEAEPRTPIIIDIPQDGMRWLSPINVTWANVCEEDLTWFTSQDECDMFVRTGAGTHLRIGYARRSADPKSGLPIIEFFLEDE